MLHDKVNSHARKPMSRWSNFYRSVKIIHKTNNTLENCIPEVCKTDYNLNGKRGKFYEIYLVDLLER